MFTFDARRLRTAGFALLAFAPASVVSVAMHANAQTPPTASPANPPATTPAPTATTPAPAPPQAAPPRINTEMLKRLAPTPPPPPKLPANVVATVNGVAITRDDLLGLVSISLGKPQINALIRQMMIENEAKRLGVSVTEAELQQGIATLKNNIVQSQLRNGTPMTYEQYAQENGITPTYLRWTVYQQTLTHSTFLKTIRQTVQQSIPPLAQQRKLEHILILTTNVPGETPGAEPTAAEQAKKDVDAKTKIDSILADIKAGKITFEDAAKQYSEDKSNAQNGGDLGFAAKKTFVESFENAAWKLTKPGEISEPVKSQFGWHLIKLVELGSAATPGEVKKYNADLEQNINKQAGSQEAMNSWISSLAAKSKVVINPSPVIVASPRSPLQKARITPAKKTASK